MLSALRGIITPAGDKITEPLRKQIFSTLVSMLDHPEDATRSAAGGCLGALTRFLDAQLDDALLAHILHDDSATAGDDWTMRHGKSAALFVALREAPAIVWQPKYEAKIMRSIMANITSDKVPIANNAVRAVGYLFEHCLTQSLSLPAALVTPFVRALNHPSNEVKQLLAKMCNYLAKQVPAAAVPADLIKVLIPMLVNGTKEKNGYVKSNAEIALVSLLRLRDGDETMQQCLGLLEAGARDSLSEVVTKVLRKQVNQAAGKEEELDDTILS